MAVTTPRIAIVGAGPAGLMLARILHHNNIPSTVFERDISATARQQGGSLDIHEDSGQQAFHAAGLMDTFRAAVRQGGEATKIMKKDGTVLFDDDGTYKAEETKGDEEQPHAEANDFVKGRPEIDRSVLKDLLIASLPADTIRWGSKVISVTQVPDSKQWKVELANGPQLAPFDLVVGADGGWSRIRSVLSDQKPLYSGVVALDVWAHNVDEAAPDVAALVGLGTCFCWGEDRALIFQRNGEGRKAEARCYACIKTDTEVSPSARELLGLENEADEGDDVDWSDLRVRETFIERNFKDWSAHLKSVYLKMNDSPVFRPLYMLPVGFTWESRPGVTLVGDSAHLMTPFAGVGVNVAFMDALELGQGIAGCVKTGNTDGNGLSEMVQRYEKGMFARSSQDAVKTETIMNLQFRAGGPEQMVKIFSGEESEGATSE
ncbi:hypothetical protein F4861DRAFT_531145 [Xylaria intraflava]|nr:hypothetical protein F4861DRAFT_531145 [Xylaria intraflava]